MKNYITILTISIVCLYTACASQNDNKEKTKVYSITSDNKVDTSEIIYDPISSINILIDTLFTISDKEFLKLKINIFNRHNDYTQYQYGYGPSDFVYYRNKTVNLQALLNNTTQLYNDTIDKSGFINFIHKDHQKNILLHNVTIDKYDLVQDELRLIFNFILPDTDIRYLILFAINRNGIVRKELIE
jgi:hypothetical protein